MNETTKKDPTKKTVLVIEDHKMISDTLRFQLLSKFNVDIAMNGKEAFSYLSSQMPDLIVMDLMLPDTSGFVLCGKIRQVERFKKVPIIILSALTDKENVDKALSLGADDFVNKPYVGQELLSKIVLALLAEKQIYVKGRMKKCPQCGNYLLKATRVCRHCNNLFSEIDETEDSKFVISDAADENIQQEFSEDKRETLLSVAKLLLPKIKTIISPVKLPFHIIEPNHLQLIIKLINQSEDENFAPLQLLSDQNNLAPKIIPISNLSFFRSEKKMTSLEDIESNCGPESLTVLVILYLVFNSIYYPPAIDQKSNSAHAHRLFNLFYDKIWPGVSGHIGCLTVMETGVHNSGPGFGGFDRSEGAPLVQSPRQNAFLLAIEYEPGALSPPGKRIVYVLWDAGQKKRLSPPGYLSQRPPPGIDRFFLFAAGKTGWKAVGEWGRFCLPGSLRWFLYPDGGQCRDVICRQYRTDPGNGKAGH